MDAALIPMVSVVMMAIAYLMGKNVESFEISFYFILLMLLET